MAVSLFDANFYRSANPDLVSLSNTQVQAHFQQWGLLEGRRFSPFVDLNFYRASNADLAGFSNQQLLDHLQIYGVQEERQFSEFVNLGFYRSNNADLSSFRGEQLFNHLQQWGVLEGRQFSPFVNLNFYRLNNRDLADLNNRQLLEHLEKHGILEGRRFSEFVDLGVYRSRNPDLAGLNPLNLLSHLARGGVNEGRQFSLTFDPNYYRGLYADLAAIGFNNSQLLQHFEIYGVDEGRISAAGFNSQVYLANNADLKAIGLSYRRALQHFVTYGHGEGRPGSDYAGNTLATARSGASTPLDFVGAGDNDDFYRLTISSPSDFSAAIAGVSSSVSLQLLGSVSGGVSSAKTGSQGKASIGGLLNPGTYYLQVSLASATQGTNYTLSSSIVPAPVTVIQPTVTIAATTPNAAEPSTPGQFTITRTGSTATALTVGYGVGGTATNGSDYSSIASSVTIAAGQSSAIIPITVLDDAVVEGNETIVLTLSSNSGYTLGSSSTGTVTIADNDVAPALPTVSLTATDSSAGESNNPGQFTLTRTGSTASALTVNYSIGGTATNGSDYSSIANSVTILAGQTSALIPINIIDDTVVEGNETIVLTLSSNSGYTLGNSSTGTVTIADNDVAPANSFNIQFDYRFDTNGWFTPARKAVLEAAANIWKGIILNEFANVPVGTELSVSNPQTGATEQFVSDVEIDDLIIFAGARNLGSELGRGGSSSFYFVGSDLDTRYNGSNFAPWTGSVSFNSSASWFFDSTPSTANDIPRNTNDFLSVAVHEIGHVLGFSNSITAFSNFISNATFTGANAKAKNGSNAIPLSPDNSHIQDSYTFGTIGESALDPSITTGTRKLPTVLDIAILDDIGYTVDYSKATQNS
jgi:hypothetical protein